MLVSEIKKSYATKSMCKFLSVCFFSLNNYFCFHKDKNLNVSF